MRKTFRCRTFGLVLVVLGLTVLVHAQTTFIPTKEKDARIEEVKQLARQLLAEPDLEKRGPLREQMVKKDVIYDDEDRPRGDGFSVPGFKELYEKGSNDLNARLQAVIGLSVVKSADADPVLIEALRDKSPAIQFLALQALRKKKAKAAGKPVVRLLNSKDLNVMTAAAECLAAVGYDENGEATRVMIPLMARHLQQLRNTNVDRKERREELQRVIEVLGRACGTLIPGLDWAPGQTMQDLEREVNKFMKYQQERAG